jgi:diadenosine tetraphosphatase ApaH/serine/threonine PP2A family protein phosphatase
MARTEPLSDAEIRDAALRWYRLLDVHAPIADLLPMLADADLEMRFPEGVVRGHAGFREWYDAVTRRFFDEEHAVKSVAATARGDGTHQAKVVVNWQARIWNPPDAGSQWLGFDAYQTWVVRRSPETGGAEVVIYTVDELRAMPGSASL